MWIELLQTFSSSWSILFGCSIRGIHLWIQEWCFSASNLSPSWHCDTVIFWPCMPSLLMTSPIQAGNVKWQSSWTIMFLQFSNNLFSKHVIVSIKGKTDTCPFSIPSLDYSSRQGFCLLWFISLLNHATRSQCHCSRFSHTHSHTWM